MQDVAISLRPANLDDVEALKRWDEEPHVTASGAGNFYDWAEEISNPSDGRELLIAARSGAPVGFVQILDPARDAEKYWGETGPGFRAIDIWIGERDVLGAGIGTRAMQLAIDRCFADSAVHTILIDPLAANTAAHRFYERLGFRFVERRKFDEDECFVYQLKRRDLAARFPAGGTQG